MKATIRIERTADPKTNLYRLSYPGQKALPGTYHDVALKGTTALTLSLSDGSSRKGLQFPSVPYLAPGEAAETDDCRAVVCVDEQWVGA